MSLPADMVSVTTGPYTIQLRTGATAPWEETVSFEHGQANGSLVYTDIVEGEMALNRVRDRFPHLEFRLVEVITIWKVVHA